MTPKNKAKISPLDKHVTVNVSIAMRNLMAIDGICGVGDRSKFIESAIEEKLGQIQSHAK